MAELSDYIQQPIHIGITMDIDGTLSGPRSLVKPIARVGGHCLERRCELNTDGQCGSPVRHVCPTMQRST